LTVA